MKLVNKTHYRSDDLRKFFRAGLIALGAETTKNITVTYSKRSSDRIWGRASYGGPDRQGRNMTMCLGKDASSWSLIRFAWVFEHEVYHTLGLRHSDMNEDTHWCRGDVLPTWAEGLQIRLRPSVTKPKQPREEKLARLIEQRQQKAWERLQEIESKLRRYLKLKKKWAAKLKRYEKRAARPKQENQQLPT